MFGNKKLIQFTIFSVGNFKDVIKGIVLGEGSFSTVREVKNISAIAEIKLIMAKNKEYSNNYQSLLMDNEEENKHSPVVYSYAIKQVRDDLSSLNRLDAFFDLANELKVLSSLCHPNIIKI
jgi:serine/threonine protein kinase